MEPYTRDYYEKLQVRARRSAEEIVPLVLDLVKPSSVIDVGCGLGSWLSVFRDLGIEDIVGVDGEHVDREMLEIPAERFMPADLRTPFQMDRQFDLVLSLEVAEHLPADRAAAFVESLVQLGPVILFSAAVPFQGGEEHLNEQWPDYWIRRFGRAGYRVIDCIRRKVWDNDRVDWWYAQNLLIFAREHFIADHPRLRRELENTSTSQIALVHPNNYLNAAWMNQVLRTALDVAQLIRPEDAFILVDQDQFGRVFTESFQVFPFLEREGRYWGPPPDGATAICELERLRRRGANYIVFGWPAFWWLDYYAGLRQHLHVTFPCVLENERVIVFDLRI